MKVLLALSLLVTLASCSKESKNKGAGIFTPPTTTPSLPGDINIPETGDSEGDQNQTSNNGDLLKPYSGNNLILSAGASGEGKIIIKDKDAARLYNRLAIKARASLEDKKLFKTAKHLKCSADTCTLNINYREADVIANADEEIGARVRKTILIPTSYKGANFTLLGRAKVGIITLDGIDAKNLFKAMKVAEISVTEETKLFMEKTGLGEAPISCRQEKGTEASEDIFTCEVRFQAPHGVVFIP